MTVEVHVVSYSNSRTVLPEYLNYILSEVLR